MWISGFRDHNNNGGHGSKNNNTFYGSGMRHTALDSLATLYLYDNYENKACGGITVLAIIIIFLLRSTLKRVCRSC